jgi:hypothetical protein
MFYGSKVLVASPIDYAKLTVATSAMLTAV